MSHTPGPWTLDDDYFVSCESGIICDPHCSHDIDMSERDANAALLAAAPDLLEAIRTLRDHMDDNPNAPFRLLPTPIAMLIDNAISKAAKR